MSDSDDICELPALNLTKFICSKEEKKIVLDPSVTLAQRQKDADLEIKIAELTKYTEPLPCKHVSSNSDSSIKVFIQKLQQPAIQEIRGSHPRRTTFLPSDFCCLFRQDCLNIKDFKFPNGRFTNSLCQMSSHELHEHICRHELKHLFLSDAVLHPLCQYLFLLMSVHRDERTVHACSNTLHCIKRDWYPSLDIILIVFLNWGISSELLDICDIEVDINFPLKLTKKLVSSPRFKDNNVEKVLELIHSVAPDLAKNSQEDKLNKLLQILVLSALDEGFKSPILQSCFSRCIGELLNAIPESQWNEHRVWTICQMLHRDGMEHFHNQAVVCCSLLIMSPHAIEISKALAFATLNHILATELKTEPLNNIVHMNLFELLMYYDPMKELNCYMLYIVIKLVDFCLLRAYVEDTLTLEHLNFMVSWLSSLGGGISTALESIDITVVKELISRCLSNWRIMKVDRAYIKLTDGDIKE